MIKHKNKDVAKRREARKRNKAVKRKTQVRAASRRHIETEYPLEYYGPKLSETIIDYAEPLMDDLGVEHAINVSILFWNMSLIEKPKAVELIGPVLGELADHDPEVREELNGLFERMYERKQRYFSYEKRAVADYELHNNGEQINLQVLSNLA